MKRNRKKGSCIESSRERAGRMDNTGRNVATASKKKAKTSICCSGGCVWIPHPVLLYRSICGVCGKDVKSHVAWYNRKRRLYRSVLELSSLIVPLHPKSRSRIIELGQMFDIHSITPNIHVTLAEGLDPKEASSREQLTTDITNAFWENNQVKVIGWDSIPTVKESSSLVILHLELCGPVETTGLIAGARAHAELPQYPLHCAVGTTSASKAANLTATNFLSQSQQLELFLNPFRLEELPPPAKVDSAGARKRMAQVLQHTHMDAK